MYEPFFGMIQRPFTALPDPGFLVETPTYSAALSALEYTIKGQAGFCVITGEVGCGKTTLVHALLHRLGPDTKVGLLSNTHRSFRDMGRWALLAFGQRPTGRSPAEHYQELVHFLVAEYGEGRRCLLVVDEAQNLTVEALEHLRVLSNVNSGSDLLLQVILVGQPELLRALKDPSLVQFAQRIAVSHHLQPLALDEVRRYIDKRLELAGARHSVFTAPAVAAIHHFAGGIPRLVNTLCDLSLVYGFADRRASIDVDLVERVVADRNESGLSQFARSDCFWDSVPDAEVSAGDVSGSTVTAAANAGAPAPVDAVADFAKESAPLPDAAIQDDSAATDAPNGAEVIEIGASGAFLGSGTESMQRLHGAPEEAVPAPVIDVPYRQDNESGTARPNISGCASASEPLTIKGRISLNRKPGITLRSQFLPRR